MGGHFHLRNKHAELTGGIMGENADFTFRSFASLSPLGKIRFLVFRQLFILRLPIESDIHRVRKPPLGQLWYLPRDPRTKEIFLFIEARVNGKFGDKTTSFSGRSLFLHKNKFPGKFFDTPS